MEKVITNIVCVLLLLPLAAVIILLIIFCVVLLEPVYPPYELELVTDINDYMNVNSYVEERLQTRYTDFFPDAIQSPEDASYRYEYSFSDRELYLTLYLEQGFSTEEEFKAEIARVRSFPDASERDCGDKKYVIFDMPNEEKIQLYLRDGDGHRV